MIMNLINTIILMIINIILIITSSKTLNFAISPNALFHHFLAPRWDPWGGRFFVVWTPGETLSGLSLQIGVQGASSGAIQCPKFLKMVPDGSQIVPISSKTGSQRHPKWFQVLPVGGLPLRFIYIYIYIYMWRRLKNMLPDSYPAT